MYKAIAVFRDLQDGHVYHPGDDFPRAGLTVDAKRINELATNNNRLGRALIQAVEQPVQHAKAEVKEEPKETTKPTQKPRRSRKKE
jgi:hypothetical protein